MANPFYLPQPQYQYQKPVNVFAPMQEALQAMPLQDLYRAKAEAITAEEAQRNAFRDAMLAGNPEQAFAVAPNMAQQYQAARHYGAEADLAVARGEKENQASALNYMTSVLPNTTKQNYREEYGKAAELFPKYIGGMPHPDAVDRMDDKTFDTMKMNVWTRGRYSQKMMEAEQQMLREQYRQGEIGRRHEENIGLGRERIRATRERTEVEGQKVTQKAKELKEPKTDRIMPDPSYKGEEVIQNVSAKTSKTGKLKLTDPTTGLTVLYEARDGKWFPTTTAGRWMQKGQVPPGYTFWGSKKGDQNIFLKEQGLPTLTE